MILKGCKVFTGKTKSGKFPHNIVLDEYHEELLAAIMLNEHRNLSNTIERALEIHFSGYKMERRSELLKRIRKLRGESDND